MFAALSLTVLLAGGLPPDLGRTAVASVTSTASDKYAAALANDGVPSTHWASEGHPKLPQSVTLTWPQPVTFDTLRLEPYVDEQLYMAWAACEVVAGGQTVKVEVPADGDAVVIVRFPKPVTAASVELRITAVRAERYYLGLSEFGVYLDPERRVQVPPSVPRPKRADELKPQGRPVHPCVYVTPEDVARARRNAAQTVWGRRIKAQCLRAADAWLVKDEAYWRQFVPAPGACYAYGFTGSPRTGATWGTWGGANCAWDRPGTVRVGADTFPDAAHPDDGTGFKNPDGRVHYFLGSWNAWVTEQWTDALGQLANAYALTGEEKYADRAAFFLDLLASIYPESSAGSWDYPSSPPSGRLARPWYQVARTLVRYIEAYDLIYASPVVDRPSLRPALEPTWTAGPRAQKRAVGTLDRRGTSHAGLTRRENIDTNLVLDGAFYCYEHAFAGDLTNGHADYLRGSLAAGALLGIPEYVNDAWNGPFSIQAMIANNCDRDGRYYETSLGYALHARDLYLTFVYPLRYWRDARHPDGMDLAADARFRSFYRLPSTVVDCAGHFPNFGDSSPDNAQRVASQRTADPHDARFAEELYAISTGPAKDEFAAILRWLGRGDVEKLRAANAGPSMLFHADPVPAGPAELPADLRRKVDGSWLLGQKGIALLRDGQGTDGQAALLRFGPSLNHGHLDDLNLSYYAKGWQLTYDLGYGLGSTHTQVGWSHQTASHSLVTVDAKSQTGPGSGGSLYLFGRLPGFKLVEADSPMSYAAAGVTAYRRTVALVGEGRDQVLVDLFRVSGGKQHDYLLAAQKQDFTVDGVALPAPAAGSLAATGEAWGRKQGTDGDLIGFPNKPYWNPPPGNGYGFFYDPQIAPCDHPWSVTWRLGGENDAHFQVYLLPEAGSQAILAKAPGLYPANHKASYALVRRTGPAGLQSTFASVLAPYAKGAETGVITVGELPDRLVEAKGSTVLGQGYGDYFFFRGQAPGDYLTLKFQVPATADYQLAFDALRYKSYGPVVVSLDGAAVGGPFDLRSDDPQPQTRFDLGRRQLTAGEHLLRFTIPAGATRFMFGLQQLIVRPAAAAAPREAQPVVGAADRLVASGGGTVVHWRRGARDEYLLSALGGAEQRVTTPHGELAWRGGVAYVAFDGGQPAAAALVGCGGLTAPGLRLVPQTAEYRGTIKAVDPEAGTVELDQPMPDAGLEGETVVFGRREWSRTSAYRLVRAHGTRLEFGDQSFLLGQGRVMDVVDDHTFLTDVAHDFGRPVARSGNSRFFDGKRLLTPGGETRIRRYQYGEPARVEVDDTRHLQKGQTVRYLDLGPGDQAGLATSVWLSRDDTGYWSVQSSVAAKVTLGPTTRDVAATGLGRSVPWAP